MLRGVPCAWRGAFEHLAALGGTDAAVVSLDRQGKVESVGAGLR